LELITYMFLCWILLVGKCTVLTELKVLLHTTCLGKVLPIEWQLSVAISVPNNFQWSPIPFQFFFVFPKCGSWLEIPINYSNKKMLLRSFDWLTKSCVSWHIDCWYSCSIRIFLLLLSFRDGNGSLLPLRTRLKKHVAFYFFPIFSVGMISWRVSSRIHAAVVGSISCRISLQLIPKNSKIQKNSN
jgi:hypothetical protein